MIWRSRSWVAFFVMFLSETGSLEVDFGNEPGRSFRHKFSDQCLLAPDQHIAADQVLQLADVSGPMVVLHQA